MTLAIVFPGQGSQAVGMLQELAEAQALVRDTFAEASAVLGFDLWEIVSEGPAERLNQTEVTQPALLAAGMAVWRCWKSLSGADPAFFAGHSLGEYTALVAAGALSFGDAVGLVRARAQFMQAAVPAGQGSMAAILGLDDAAVMAVCEQAAEEDVVEAVNFNAPGQVVIAGHARAVERAMKLAKQNGAKRALPLAVSVPSHCALMEGAAEKLADALARCDFQSPSIPVMHNVDVSSHEDGDSIRRVLAEQLYRPVRWTETIRRFANEGVDKVLELGPGKVLSGLNKRIDGSLTVDSLSQPQAIQQAVA